MGARVPLGHASAKGLSERLEAELRIIPGACHFIIEDHPDEVADARPGSGRSGRLGHAADV